MAVEVDFRDEKAYAVFANSLPKDFTPINKEEFDAKKELFSGKNEEVNKMLIDGIKDKLGIPKPKDPTAPTMFDELINAAKASEEKIVEQIKEEEPKMSEEDEAIMEQAKNTPAEDGEIKTVMVEVNPSTGERIIMGNGEFKPDSTSFDEVLEADGESDALSDTPIDDSTIANELKNKFEDISDKDIKEFVDIAQKYKAKKISAMEAFNELPKAIKDKINIEIFKAGIPASQANTYRRQTVKSFMEDLLTSAEIEQSSIDFDKQIASIYKEYGNDIGFLYQSSMYEKIKTLRQSITDMEKDNEDGSLTEKIEKIHCIIDSLYESFELNDFADFAIRKKIKQIYRDKVQKIYREFNSKYDDSKFIISDVSLILEPLKKYCGFTDNEAQDMSILFCKFCDNMKPSNLEDHAFMYYFIANIISLNINGIKDENDRDEFANILIHNLKKIMDLRKEYQSSDKSSIPAYEPRIISQEYMDSIIEKAAERTKQIEEENAAIEKQMAEEDDIENSEDKLAETTDNTED